MGVLSVFAGKKRFQKLCEIMFFKSLAGMNYGNGGLFDESGELEVLNIVKAKYKQNQPLTIFDVGANIGSYSKSLVDVFGGNAAIHSFEPSKRTFEQLIKNISHISTITANNFGLSDKEGTLLLYTMNDASGLSSVYQRNLDHLGISMDENEEIKLSTVDNYCIENKIERIHFLKLDIEGHELNALKGASRMLANNRVDVIQFEFGGCNIDSRTFFQDFYYLLKDNYRIYRILKNGLIEIPEYKETCEIFITINYLAVRKE